MMKYFIGSMVLTMSSFCLALNVNAVGDLKEYTQILNQTDSKDYQMTVNFGTPPQRASGYTFNVDTTVDFLITSTNLCQKCNDSRGDVSFNMSESTTVKNLTTQPQAYLLPGKLEI